MNIKDCGDTLNQAVWEVLHRSQHECHRFLEEQSCR